MEIGWSVLALVTVLLAMLLCAVYAMVTVCFRQPMRRSSNSSFNSMGNFPNSATDFITAKGSAGLWMLSCSFYAGAMGSWVVTAPANYASFAGIIGLVSYSLAAGAPLVIVAYAGGWVRDADPEAISLPDFLKRRFSIAVADSTSFDGRTALPAGSSFFFGGSAIAAIASCVTIFVMSVAMLAEYATLGSLFLQYVRTDYFVAVVPTIFLAALTLSYTVAGGLYVSMLTDRVQAAGSVILVGVIIAFMTDFRPPPGGLPPLTEDQIGTTYYGYSSLFTMPLALVSATLYSEAVWQRVWASEDNATLRRAAWLGGASVTLVVFFFGFVGFLALWSGRADLNTTHPNLYFFAFFSKEVDAQIDSVPGLAALVCAALMAEGAVDSLQNGITATISSTLLKDQDLGATRLMVLLVNVPLAILGATPLVQSVLSLFLLSNMLTISCMIPLVVSLIPGPTAHRLVTEAAVVIGCFSGIAGVSLYGIIRKGTIGDGIYMAWLGNNYAFDYFLVALVCSGIGTAAGCYVQRRRALEERHCDEAVDMSTLTRHR